MSARGKLTLLFKYFIKKLAIVFLLCLVLRIFCMDIFLIPSGSMENTAYQGDYIYVDKLPFGARLPGNLREVPWLNFFEIFSTKQSKTSDFSSNYRMPGFSRIKHGSIVVFNKPDDLEGFYIKRCVALPGDHLSLTDSGVLINGKAVDNHPNVKMAYLVSIKPNTDHIRLFKNLHIPYNAGWFERKQLNKVVLLTQEQKKILVANSNITGLKRYTQGNSDSTSHTQEKPQLSLDSNNTNNFQVPYTGMKMILDSVTFNLYGATINAFEKIELIKKNNCYYLNSKKIDSFTFKNNYYFMLGDNRDYSMDSRAFGLIPEFYIIGIAKRVIYSSVHWRRTFKSL
jgi:signal peptidase I